MKGNNERTIVVTGATGRQGGAVARHLLRDGWDVRAITRNPLSPPARALEKLGAKVLCADMQDPSSLQPIFEGAYGVFSVQTPYPKGADAEITQGKNVADAAAAARVEHVVYGSAGIGTKGTGIPSWETKLEIEEHMRSLGLPVTVFRPMAFMELMTDPKFFPAVSAWHLMPKLVGADRPLPWLCTDDLGAIARKAFARPDDYIGQDLRLASDEQSLGACQVIYRRVMGKNPPRFPMPVAIFKNFGFMGQDLIAMWTWLCSGTVSADIDKTRAILPDARSVETYLCMQRKKIPAKAPSPC